ncbi:MAG TPA: GNAT family N-acetyltransferase [Acidimicrobiia bacterium]|jgi:GNAT superfamily N-acetyltransferase
MSSNPELRIVPANQASWEDLVSIVGKSRCYDDLCFCQRFKIPTSEWRSVSDAERAHRLRMQTECGHPGSDSTSGLVAYAGAEPAGWCAVEPRIAYPKLKKTRVPWTGRDEDKDDPDVWAVTCFVTRAGMRHTGISRAMCQAAVDFARDRGAAALEGYSMLTEPGKEITWGELHVGSRSIFEAAGFEEVSRPSLRRVVMRIDF